MKFTPYSFSKISCFQHCQKQFELKYINKIYIPSENIALEKGSYIHSVIENHIIDKAIPNFDFKLSKEKDINDFNDIIVKFLKSDLYKDYKSLNNKMVERGFSISLNGKEIEVGEYKKDSIIRGYIDFMAYDEMGKSLLIVDWKSGKYKEDINELQIKIYALWGFYTFDVDYITTEFCFVEHNKTVNQQFKRKDIPKLKKDIFEQVLLIEKAKEFKKNPTPLCQWCDYKKQGYCDGNYDFHNMNIKTGL